MALTKEDLQAIGNLIDQKLEPIHKKLEEHDKRFDKIEERSKQAAIQRQHERVADKAELKKHTEDSIKKLKAKFS